MPEVRDVNWGDLTWQQFQGLVNRLLYLHSVYGLGNIKGRLIRPFEAAGKDGGIDGRFEGVIEGEDRVWAVQAKSGMHALGQSGIKQRLSVSVIREWASEVQKRGFTGGLLVCDGKVNPATASEIERRIRDAGLEPKFWYSSTLKDMVAATPQALVYDLSMLLPLDEYQRTMLGPNAERYGESPIGRDSEVQIIAEFLADDSKRVLFMEGPKYSGKTHVLVAALRRVVDPKSPADSTFLQVGLWPAFLNPRVSSFSDPSREIGDRHGCVFVVDGVEQFVGKPLYGDFVGWFLSRQGVAAHSKLIACFRSSAEDTARQPFLGDPRSRTVERVECQVGPLHDHDFEALIRRLGLDTRHVVPLALLTGRLPGWLDAVKELVTAGRSPADLRSEDLTRGALNEVLHVLKRVSREPQRALVWLALNGPVGDAAGIHERLAESTGITVAEASHVFASLNRSGYLRQYSAGFGQVVVSITPDAVGQAAIATTAEEDKQFLTELVMQSLPTNGGNILRNLAMAEASPSEEATASVLDSVLKTLEDAVVDMPNADRWTVTAQLTNIAWVRPRQVLGIAEAIVENPLPPDNLGDATAALALIDHKWAVHGMPVVLKAVVRATPDRDVRNRALDILLDLWRVDPDRRGWADSPGEVMDHVFTPNPGIPLSFYVELFNWVEAKSSDPSDAS
ncbi:MAG TPA: hypothetical protein VM537_05710, partial [Anaerolineae bacterium]|nr:hypothetical protein [Anaerolineae bacterium]